MDTITDMLRSADSLFQAAVSHQYLILVLLYIGFFGSVLVVNVVLHITRKILIWTFLKS